MALVTEPVMTGSTSILLLHLRGADLLHPASACSPQLPTDRLVLPLLGLPRWLSHLLCPPLGKLPEERADKGRATQLEPLEAARYPGLFLRSPNTPLP